MTGKGDGRLHARQQCSDEEMQARWDRVFGKHKALALGDEKGVTYYYDGKPIDALAGDGDTFEEKVSLSDEMQLHGDKHKPEGL